MLRHGYVPKSLRDCILQPIPKPGKDCSVSDNYRSIALAPTLRFWIGAAFLRSFCYL